MSLIADNLAEIGKNIVQAEKNSGANKEQVKLIAVSKTFTVDDIRPALEAGHRIFGENRVQESHGKWPELRKDYDDVELHLIGPLQSNKARQAVDLFDVIHTVDREKIAKVLAKEARDQGKALACFVQVNTGMEPQKAGVPPQDTAEFVNNCREIHGLDICGLMCIPPIDENPGPHFALMSKLAREAGVEKLSMGMSADYELAIQFGATHVRVGSAIFGVRTNLPTG